MIRKLPLCSKQVQNFVMQHKQTSTRRRRCRRRRLRRRRGERKVEIKKNLCNKNVTFLTYSNDDQFVL